MQTNTSGFPAQTTTASGAFQADLFYTSSTAPPAQVDYHANSTATRSNTPVNSRSSSTVVKPRYSGIYRYTANLSGKRTAYAGTLTRESDGYTLAFQHRRVVQRGAKYQLIDFTYPTDHTAGYVSLLFPVRGDSGAYTFRYDRRYRVARIDADRFKITVL